MDIFVNSFLKQDEWIKRNKSCFKLLDDFGVGVAIISSKMEVLALNKVTKKWFPNINVGERPICYKSFNIPPRDEICEYCPTIKTLRDGKVHEAITETPAGDKIINYRLVSSPVRDEKGNVIAAIEVVEDITEHLQADEVLKKSQYNLNAILNGIPDIAWMKDKESIYIAANEPLAKAAGMAPGDMVGKTDLDIWPKKLAEKYRADDKEVIKTGKQKFIEEPIVYKDGTTQFLETIKTPVYNDKGEVIGTIGIARDITERSKLQEQLRISEEKYRRFFEEANDAIFIADAGTGKILDANARAEILLGRTKDEICRMHQSQLHPLEEAERYKAMFKEDASKGRSTHVEAEVINKKGEITPVFINASIHEIGGKRVVIGIFRDMSEFKRIEKEKKEAESLALVDPHTQLYNYRYFQRRIYSEFEAAKRRGTPLSVLMVDIDYFKSINDTYGHEYGDVVLQEFATVLQHVCRGIDVVTRFEGEGFAIILPDTDEKGAVSFSERIQSVVKKHRFGKHRVRLMVSIGAVSYPSEGINSVDKLVTSVDKCVQMAKEKGGNTIFVYEQLRYKGQKPATIDRDSQRRVKEVSRKFIKLIQLNKQNTIEAVYALAHTVGAKNAYTEEHSEDMIHYATEIGKRLRMSEEELEDLKHGAMLHDIGKLGISDKILLKRGKLTKKEFGAIKKHPHIGADIIRPMHFLKSVVPIILHHHERFDGAGYGSRLKGEEIPLGARIVAIVDVYQALVSNRPYRKAYSKREAIDIIKEESGGHFDPKITKVFLEILAKEKKTKKKGAAKKR
ncbi:MAG: diguanylate cyclase [Candidatus Omnitrophota bacterium]|nr:diguanylate cyclase [Candidatus Omnitrophota bacterium]